MSLPRASSYWYERGAGVLIDSHVMVWSKRFDPRHNAPAWLDQSLRTATYDRTLPQVDGDMDAAGITHVVLVQTANELGHTDELLEAARTSKRPARVVGWLPIQEPKRLAAALRRYAGETLLTGVRHRILDTEDPQLLLRPGADRCLDEIQAAGLTLDVLPWPASVLAQVPIIASRHPELKIVINLMGWPDVAAKRMQPWTDHLAAAAAQPEVYIKAAGMQRLTHGELDPKSLRPYTATILDLFGPDRIMLASDWPANNLYGQSYGDAMSTAVAAFGWLAEPEREQITGRTAFRVYGF